MYRPGDQLGFLETRQEMGWSVGLAWAGPSARSRISWRCAAKAIEQAERRGDAVKGAMPGGELAKAHAQRAQRYRVADSTATGCPGSSGGRPRDLPAPPREAAPRGCGGPGSTDRGPRWARSCSGTQCPASMSSSQQPAEWSASWRVRLSAWKEGGISSIRLCLSAGAGVP